MSRFVHDGIDGEKDQKDDGDAERPIISRLSPADKLDRVARDEHRTGNDGKPADEKKNAI